MLTGNWHVGDLFYCLLSCFIKKVFCRSHGRIVMRSSYILWPSSTNEPSFIILYCAYTYVECDVSLYKFNVIFSSKKFNKDVSLQNGFF